VRQVAQLDAVKFAARKLISAKRDQTIVLCTILASARVESRFLRAGHLKPDISVFEARGSAPLSQSAVRLTPNVYRLARALERPARPDVAEGHTPLISQSPVPKRLLNETDVRYR
jgi:hypothetical protein